MISPARGGPIVKIPTVEPGCCSLMRKACSSAFKSSGLKIAGNAARLMVPSAFIASLPTFRVSGTCLASTTIFKLIFMFLIYDLSLAKVNIFCSSTKKTLLKMHKKSGDAHRGSF